jgi:hypothetical protein
MDLEQFTAPGEFVDSGDPGVQEFAQNKLAGAEPPKLQNPTSA